jgi:hypothetical protein
MLNYLGFNVSFFLCGYRNIDGIMDGLNARTELDTRDVLATDNKNMQTVYI